MKTFKDIVLPTQQNTHFTIKVKKIIQILKSSKSYLRHLSLK